MQRLLRFFGPSWRSSPVRRLCQAISFSGFLVLFFYVAWPYADIFSTHLFSRKEKVPAEIFLWSDPLVGLSTAIAARAWNVALVGLAAILLLGVVAPRSFCGFICPLGTLIDLMDWLIWKRLRRWNNVQPGRWAHFKYYLLIAILACAGLGVLSSGFFAAIPVLTRGLMFSAGHIQLGMMKSWSIAGGLTAAMIFSLALFAAVFLLSLLGPRFWCRYVCPSGAIFSVFNLFRANQRRVDQDCISCGKCTSACPFDAIKPDFTTRASDCTFCQTCAGVCPTQSIHFDARWSNVPQKRQEGDGRPAISRRAALASLVAGAGCAAGIPRAFASKGKLLRPPGSVIERDFLDLCIRCGECFKVCPGPVLHPAGLEGGLEALWTPVAIPSHAGCHQDCNFCTQVCPTEAIRPLTIAQKRVTHMGLAKVNPSLCLPHRGEKDCDLCYQECMAAGYRAIRMQRIKLSTAQVPDGALSPDEVEEMGYINAPVVDPVACVGCGLCEYRCNAALVNQQKLLPRSAIVIAAENEDRP